MDRVAAERRPLVIWRFVDGKPGHESQSLGLVSALSALLPVVVHEVPSAGGLRDWGRLVTGRCPQCAQLPQPDLLIGAGHATHAAMLACRRARGGRVVVLMRPSLPATLFDLSLVPEHDGVPASERVLLTRGVLNSVRLSAAKDRCVRLILVGGPSAHYGWDEQQLFRQVADILDRGEHDWVLATSRRTPAATVSALRALAFNRLRVVPCEETAPGWLVAQLGHAAEVWVTEDSVSMLYEALTAGAACGVLPVPVRRAGRVRKGLEALLRDDVVVGFDAWRTGRRLHVPAEPFDEASRCARWIVAKWFED